MWKVTADNADMSRVNAVVFLSYEDGGDGYMAMLDRVQGAPPMERRVAARALRQLAAQLDQQADAEDAGVEL